MSINGDSIKDCEFIRFFVKSGIDINCRYSKGQNILHKYLNYCYADENGTLLILNAGIDVNQTCDQGNNPLLHYLSKPWWSRSNRFSESLFNTIFNAGIDNINAVNHCKDNLLHVYFKNIRSD